MCVIGFGSLTGKSKDVGGMVILNLWALMWKEMSHWWFCSSGMAWWSVIFLEGESGMSWNRRALSWKDGYIYLGWFEGFGL